MLVFCFRKTDSAISTWRTFPVSGCLCRLRRSDSNCRAHNARTFLRVLCFGCWLRIVSFTMSVAMRSSHQECLVRGWLLRQQFPVRSMRVIFSIVSRSQALFLLERNKKLAGFPLCDLRQSFISSSFTRTAMRFFFRSSSGINRFCFPVMSYV